MCNFSGKDPSLSPLTIVSGVPFPSNHCLRRPRLRLDTKVAFNKESMFYISTGVPITNVCVDFQAGTPERTSSIVVSGVSA